jgi:hypothetical protein
MEWISVKDRLPTKEECKKYQAWFLVYRPQMQKRPDMSRYDKYNDLSNGHDHGWKYAYDYLITHWMELADRPEIYEEDL